jgi:hypothetical protein
MAFPLPEIWGNNMLQSFGDIVLPDDVAWWPIQPGWWVLLGIMVLLLGAYLYRRYRHWKRNAYRRLALKQLSSMTSLREMNVIMKHAVGAAFPAESSAELWGSNWINYLNSKTSKACFVEGDDTRYSSLLTQPESNWPADIETLKARTQAWLEQHKEAAL